MTKHLPPHPSLGSLHNQAKQLLQAYRANTADARRRFHSNHPQFSDADGCRLQTSIFSQPRVSFAHFQHLPDVLVAP